MDSILSTLSTVIFLLSCAVLALLVASFFWQLVVYATGKSDDAKRAKAKKLIMRFSAFILLFMLAWWLIPLGTRMIAGMFLS